MGNIYTGSATENPEEALTIYRRVLVAGLWQLPLWGVEIGASDPKGGQGSMELDQVYVSLFKKPEKGQVNFLCLHMKS